jgi:lipopolysaccharide transport system ATP-binding protein
MIGRNGAGKSTLLKLLARITGPTTGTIDIHGRLASLLEVGTGFHPELSGRENIFLNGAILGMTRREIGRKFDEIVAFAEIEKFLDTPVKRYSSGMYVRLAFAVAAHLEPEILIVDEVLAVGDNNFQKKCLSKMEAVSDQGRTVLFVSHNMNTVTRICPRAILLRQGQTIADGPANEVTQVYLRSEQGTMASRSWSDLATAPGNDIARLRSVRVHNEEGETTEVVDIRRPVAIEMTFEVLRGGHVLMPNHHFYNEDGICAFVANDGADPDWGRCPRPAGLYTSTLWIPGNFLAEGMMSISPCVSTLVPEAVHFWERDAIAFQVIDSHDGDSVRGDYVGTYPGVVRPQFRWETNCKPRGAPVALNGRASERRMP